MSNSNFAFPQLEVQCQDRVRTFCLNFGAFRALEEFMQSKPEIQKKHGADYSVFKHFPWASEKVSDVVLLMWAGFSVDAREDKEPWTVDKAERVVSVLSLPQMRQCIETSLANSITPEQQAKLDYNAQKKTSQMTPAKRGRKPKAAA